MNSKLIKSGIILTIGSLLASSFNYLFTLIVGRLLGPALFGEVASIFALVAIIGVPAGALSLFMIKRSASLLADDKLSDLRQTINLASKYSLLAGLFLLVIYFLFLPSLGGFLGVSLFTLVVFGLTIPASLALSVSNGTLLGFQDFLSFSVSGIIGAASKLVLAVLLVGLGLAVNGVIGALVLATLVSYFYSKFQLAKKLPRPVADFPLPTDRRALDLKNAWPYLSLAFWALLLLAIIGNLDIILAKHYLSADWAGQYAALSTIGKIVLYGVSPFITAMFPLVSRSHALDDGLSRKHLAKSLQIITALALCAVIFYFLIPRLIVSILFGSKYLAVASYLPLAALAMYFMAVVTALVNYFVAIHSRRFIWPLTLALLIQLLSLGIYHHSLAEIIGAEVISMFFAVLLLLSAYLYTNRQKHGSQPEKTDICHYPGL